jgi:hypothetical protein
VRGEALSYQRGCEAFKTGLLKQWRGSEAFTGRGDPLRPIRGRGLSYQDLGQLGQDEPASG